ncbi:MAG: DinB family protein [Mitsuaria chitosanitabida]|uniref:DinB family protein n=1 Tax=Roseateles chitosanitabidus TaxID=65048 RepID=UPI001B26F761|nr:DinB family protein [Roseateles chitosanitabidus]MBO9688486.1 DinB family protein [Roseateles chitosanitabidus]
MNAIADSTAAADAAADSFARVLAELSADPLTAPSGSAVDPVTLEALAAFPRLLAAHFALFPVDARHWAPASWDGVPSEPLTAIEQLCHVRDIEIDGYQRRIRRTLTEEDPLLVSLDTDQLARDRRYGEDDPARALAAFAAARRETLAMLATVTPAQLQRRARFEGYGPLTFKALVHYLCSHDQQHLAGLQWVLGQHDAAAIPR